MITQRDITELKKTFVTKSDLKNALMDLKIELTDQLKTRLTQLKSDFFDKFDAFVKEVRDSHEEREIMAGQISELYDRVEKLESPQAS